MEILQRGFERISETIFATIKIRWCGQCNSSDQVFYRKWLHQIFRRNSAYIAPHPVRIESFVRIWYSSLQVFFLPQVSTYKVTLEHCPIAIVQVLSLSLLSTLTLSENYFLQPLFLTSTASLSLSCAGTRMRGRAQYRDQLQTTLQRKPNNAVLHKWKRKERQDILCSKESRSRICVFL